MDKAHLHVDGQIKTTMKSRIQLHMKLVESKVRSHNIQVLRK